MTGKRCHGDPRHIRVATILCCFCGRERQFHCQGAGQLDVYSSEPPWLSDLKCSECKRKWFRVTYADHKWPDSKWTRALESLRAWLLAGWTAREQRRKAKQERLASAADDDI